MKGHHETNKNNFRYLRWTGAIKPYDGRHKGKIFELKKR
jgi:hypothetical protein